MPQLFDAVVLGDDSKVRMQLQAGADPDERDRRGKTPLMEVGSTHTTSLRHSEITTALLQARADIDARAANGSTALGFAALNGRHRRVSELLASCANVNIASAVGNTPLMNAVHKEHVGICLALLAARADVAARHESGRTALHFAAEGGRLQVVEALVDGNADVNAVDEEGVTPLIAATEAGKFDVVNALVSAGAEIDARDIDGNAAFEIAVETGKNGIAGALEPCIARTIVMLSLEEAVEGEVIIECNGMAGNKLTRFQAPADCTVADVRGTIAELLGTSKARLRLVHGACLLDNDAVGFMASCKDE